MIYRPSAFLSPVSALSATEGWELPLSVLVFLVRIGRRSASMNIRSPFDVTSVDLNSPQPRHRSSISYPSFVFSVLRGVQRCQCSYVHGASLDVKAPARAYNENGCHLLSRRFAHAPEFVFDGLPYQPAFLMVDNPRNAQSLQPLSPFVKAQNYQKIILGP